MYDTGRGVKEDFAIACNLYQKRSRNAMLPRKKTLS
jgi:hypothetical protein